MGKRSGQNLLTVDEKIRNLNIYQQKELFRIVDEIINSFDQHAVDEIFSGYSEDTDELLELIFNETYNSLYCNKRGNLVEMPSTFNYLENLTKQLDEQLKVHILNYFIISTMPDFEMNWHHIEWGNLCQMFKMLGIIASRDHGKTWIIDTEIVMYDGSIKKVQDIKVGDLVMGVDSTPRKVLSTHSLIDEGYRIDQSNAISYVINQEHILHYKFRDKKTREETVIEESAKCFYKKSESYRDNCFGYKIIWRGENKFKKIIKSRLEITKLKEKQKFYGFEVDKDHLLLLKDGTVQHNSYFFSKAYPLWKMYRYKRFSGKKDIDLCGKGMLITSDHSLGTEFMEEITGEIEGNDLLKEKLYPKNRMDSTWGKEKIKCKNGARLQIRSYGSKMRGRHIGWIVVDDLLTDNVLYSSDQRKKYNDLFLSVIMNMLVPNGDIIAVGTPFITSSSTESSEMLGNFDLYGLLKRLEGWKVFEYPAIFPDGTILWENRYNYKALMTKKKTLGNIIFSREILCKPVSAEATIFPYHVTERSYIGMSNYMLVKNIHSFNKKFVKVVVGCDFAISERVGADYTVYTVIGVDDLDNYWLLYMWRERGASYNRQVAMLKEINSNFNPDIILAEDNAFQKVMIQIATDEGLRITGHTTGKNKFDMYSGLPAMAVLFEQNRIRIPRGDQFSRDMSDILTQELGSITWDDRSRKLQSAADHDDTAMSLWIAIRAAHYISGDFDFSFI